MHLAFLLSMLAAVLQLAILAACLTLSLAVVGLKTSSATFYKVTGFAAAFIAVGWATFILSDAQLLPVGVLLVIGAAAWTAMLQRTKLDGYSMERAAGAYVLGFAVAIAIMVGIAMLGTAYVSQITKINNDAMTPAVKADQTVLVYRLNKQPEANSIVAYTDQQGTELLGRVSGTPGQVVSIKSGSVEVGGELQTLSSYKLSSTQYYVTTDNTTYGTPARIVNANDLVGTVEAKF